ncbi:MAG: molybdopterin molybdotransferase MoeA [Pseudomonadota bacterium]|nr:molybdopterin molybdotransferase MoeA [Pseudomonadota bacterium]
MEKKAKLLKVDAAVKIIYRSIKPIKLRDKIGIEKSAGRILANTIISKRDQPSQSLSSMDGYAVRKIDLKDLPKNFKIIEEIKAGNSPKLTLGKNQASRIFTGAPIPKGSSKVIIQENCTQKDSKVLIRKNNTEDYIRKKGSDFDSSFKLEAPKIISNRDIALIGAMNHKEINVYKKPKIAVLANGDELDEIGVKYSKNRQPASSKPAIISLIRNYGGEAIDLGIAKDKINNIKNKIKQGMKCDLMVTIGGASVGKHDLIRQSLKDLGFTLNFWKIAMQPGKPLMFGNSKKFYILGLPGNPVSALVCTQIFLKKAIYALQGYNFNETLYSYRTSQEIKKSEKRRQYLRGIIVKPKKDGKIYVKPFKDQDSASLSTYSKSDVLIIREPNSPKVVKGSKIKAILTDN